MPRPATATLKLRTMATPWAGEGKPGHSPPWCLLEPAWLRLGTSGVPRSATATLKLRTMARHVPGSERMWDPNIKGEFESQSRMR